VATGKQITYDLNKVDGSVTMRSIKGTHLDNFKKLSDAELALLFTKANQQDEASVNKLVSYYSPIVKRMILNFQPKNIPAKYMFTELYDSWITELKTLVIKYDMEGFYKSVEWCIRQKLLGFFAVV